MKPLSIPLSIFAGVCHGSFGVLFKIQRVRNAQVSPAVFGYWMCQGASLAFLLPLLLPNRTLVWESVLSGALLVLSIACTFPAVARLGVAVAVGIWSTTAVLASCAWGLVVVHDVPRHHGRAIVGFVCLLSAVVGLAATKGFGSLGEEGPQRSARKSCTSAGALSEQGDGSRSARPSEDVESCTGAGAGAEKEEIERAYASNPPSGRYQPPSPCQPSSSALPPSSAASTYGLDLGAPPQEPQHFPSPMLELEALVDDSATPLLTVSSIGTSRLAASAALMFPAPPPPARRAPSPRLRRATGVALALATGASGGLILAPMATWVPRSSQGLAYLPGCALGALPAAALLAWAQGGARGFALYPRRIAAGPGMAAGAIWALGTAAAACAVADPRVGMTVTLPVQQGVGVAVAGLWGMLAFAELSREGVLLFAACLPVLVEGVFLLAQSTFK